MNTEELNQKFESMSERDIKFAEMEELLRSALHIAERRGEVTHWERFAESIRQLGISSVTARTYRILPSDTPPDANLGPSEKK